MTDIEQLLDELVSREGGYVRDPRDAGGATKYGITEAVARAHGFGGAMEELPLATAKDIYRRLYWTKPGYDQVAAIYPKVAAELFDTGVNMGPAVATGFLQRALNGLNRGGKDYADLALDSRIGPGTIAALEAYKKLRSWGGEEVLLIVLNALQGERYLRLAEITPKNEAFLYGWLANRVKFGE